MLKYYGFRCSYFILPFMQHPVYSSSYPAAGASIYCAQCSTAESPYCRRHPPSPSLCPADSRYCLIMEEYQPSHLGQYHTSQCQYRA